MEDFTLQNDPPPPKKWRPETTEKGRQQVLFTGLNCLAGQEDLFQADGPPVAFHKGDTDTDQPEHSRPRLEGW